MKGFMEGFLFRPQGKPMVTPYTFGAKLSRFPYRHVWHECWHIRYVMYSYFFLVLPIYWQIDKKLTSPENKAFWKAKRQHDKEHHLQEMEKLWEVRT